MSFSVYSKGNTNNCFKNMLFYNSFIILLPISLSATDPLPRGPNFCADNYVDSAFSVGKEIFLTRDDWIWKIKDITQIDSPFRQIDLSFLSINFRNKYRKNFFLL